MAVAAQEVVSAMPCRSVEIAQRQEVDMWEFADAVYGDALARMSKDDVVRTTSAAHGVHSGITKAIEAVYEEHRKAGTDKTEGSLRVMFGTVRAWPAPERRPALASFEVHAALRGKDYKDRAALIERQAAASRTGRWSFRDFRRWQSERKPAAFKTFAELFEERVRRVAYQSGKPWTAVAEADRFTLARVMRDIANEIEAGTFGTDS